MSKTAMSIIFCLIAVLLVCSGCGNSSGSSLEESFDAIIKVVLLENDQLEAQNSQQSPTDEYFVPIENWEEYCYRQNLLDTMYSKE